MASTPKTQNLHQSFRFLLGVAQCFGFFPAQGVWSNNVNSLKFSWISVRTAITLCMGLVAFFGSFAHVRMMLVKSFFMGDFGGVIFNFCNGSHFFSFLFLARQWPEFIRKIYDLEIRLSRYGWPKNLNLKLQLISGVFLLLELGEHVNNHILTISRVSQTTNTLDELLEKLLKNNFAHVFDMIPYTHFMGIVLQIVNTCLACVWTYSDLFVIILSYYMSVRFHQISRWVKHLKKNNNQNIDEWKNVRQNYNILCSTCRTANEQLSTLILISFFTNIFFLVMGFFFILHEEKSALEKLRDVMRGLGLLIIRSSFVCWFGGKLKEETEKIRQNLFSLPSKIYNVEIQRFIDELRYTTLAITGKDFFEIEKGLILNIIGAILTYELIMAQFISAQDHQAKILEVLNSRNIST